MHGRQLIYSSSGIALMAAEHRAVNQRCLARSDGSANPLRRVPLSRGGEESDIAAETHKVLSFASHSRLGGNHLEGGSRWGCLAPLDFASSRLKFEEGRISCSWNHLMLSQIAPADQAPPALAKQHLTPLRGSRESQSPSSTIMTTTSPQGSELANNL